MTTPDSGPACPVDLHYPEPHQANLDLSAIIGQGKRIGHRRRLTQLGAVLAACVAVTSVIAGSRGFTISVVASQSGPAAAPSAAPIDALVAEDPPANGELTLISSWPRHWSTVAWATRRGDVCWATFRSPMQGATEEVECPAWRHADLPGRSDIAGSLWPDLALAGSSAPISRTAWPILGLANPRAVRVVLTAYGKNVSASVVLVPISAGKNVGVFLAWIRAPGGGFNSSAITSEIAYDRSGRSIPPAPGEHRQGRQN
jgi:hypothetical protein